MAIDTRNKRSSAINPGCPWRGLWPAPDGSIGAGDRAQVDFMYGGFTGATNAGYRSFLAFWMGGASNPGGGGDGDTNDIFCNHPHLQMHRGGSSVVGHGL